MENEHFKKTHILTTKSITHLTSATVSRKALYEVADDTDWLGIALDLQCQV